MWRERTGLNKVINFLLQVSARLPPIPITIINLFFFLQNALLQAKGGGRKTENYKSNSKGGHGLASCRSVRPCNSAAPRTLADASKQKLAPPLSLHVVASFLRFSALRQGWGAGEPPPTLTLVPLAAHCLLPASSNFCPFVWLQAPEYWARHAFPSKSIFLSQSPHSLPKGKVLCSPSRFRWTRQRFSKST